MDRKVYNRIRRYKRDFDINTQRAKLLLRNRNFQFEYDSVMDITQVDRFAERDELIKEFRHTWTIRYFLDNFKDLLSKIDYESFSKELSKIMPLDELNFESYTAIVREQFEPLGLGNLPMGSQQHLLFCLREWGSFCERWGIKSDWDGAKTTLKDHLKFAVEVIYKPGDDGWHSQLLLKITEWTTMNDVKSIWNRVEAYQNLMSKKLEKKTNFTRDLCWYDLNKELGLKPSQIAEIWIEKYPEQIEELVVRRMRKEIKQDTKREWPDDQELLIAIKTGDLKDEYSSYFEEEKVLYTTGKQDSSGKINPPFVAAIKKAIKRMGEQIDQIQAISPESPPERGSLLSRAQKQLKG